MWERGLLRALGRRHAAVRAALRQRRGDLDTLFSTLATMSATPPLKRARIMFRLRELLEQNADAIAD
jgi:acyl-CoA reductase-like NAD-dependent aldehyde dehydrogenase